MAVGPHGESGPYVTVRVETVHECVTEVARSQNLPSMEPIVKETASNTKWAICMFVKVPLQCLINVPPVD